MKRTIMGTTALVAVGSVASQRRREDRAWPQRLHEHLLLGRLDRRGGQRHPQTSIRRASSPTARCTSTASTPPTTASPSARTSSSRCSATSTRAATPSTRSTPTCDASFGRIRTRARELGRLHHALRGALRRPADQLRLGDRLHPGRTRTARPPSSTRPCRPTSTSAATTTCITYYTPRFWGFQLGLTYAPSVVGNGDGKNFPVEADTETEYNNGFAVGVNYVEDFNGFGVAISGGWRYAQVDDAISDCGLDDYQAISAGLNLSYAGFTIGGSYANEYDGMVTGDAIDGFVSTEGQSWDVGVDLRPRPLDLRPDLLPRRSRETRSRTPARTRCRRSRAACTTPSGPGITLSGGVMWASGTPRTASQLRHRRRGRPDVRVLILSLSPARGSRLGGEGCRERNLRLHRGRRRLGRCAGRRAPDGIGALSRPAAGSRADGPQSLAAHPGRLREDLSATSG